MNDSEKSVWEEKCKKMNKEVAARMAAENADNKNDRWVIRVIEHVLAGRVNSVLANFSNSCDLWDKMYRHHVLTEGFILSFPCQFG